MPIGFSFKRRRSIQKPSPNKEQLQTELSEAISKLTEFSESLRKELKVSNAEEDRINGEKR